MPNENVADPALIQFVRTIKEMEGLVRQARKACSDEAGCRALDQDLPEQWCSVFHMARVAPALLSCLAECVGVIEDELLDLKGGDTCEALLSLLESCDSVLAIASGGARPSHQVLH